MADKPGTEKFVIKRVSRYIPPSWEGAIAVLMLIMSVIIGDACADTQLDPSWIVHGDKKYGSCDLKELKEGWCDENTFWIHAKGMARKKFTDPEERKKISRAAAILNGQDQVFEEFKKLQIIVATGGGDDNSLGTSVAAELAYTVKNKGTVIAERYDEQQNCEIIYEIKSKDLKKKIQLAYWGL